MFSPPFGASTVTDVEVMEKSAFESSKFNVVPEESMASTRMRAVEVDRLLTVQAYVVEAEEILSATTVGNVDPEFVESLMRKWSIVPDALQVTLYASPPVSDSPPFGVTTVTFVWTMEKSAS